MSLSRRQFFSGAAAIAGSALLGACGRPQPEPAPDPSPQGTEASGAGNTEATATAAASAPAFDLEAGTVTLNDGNVMPLVGIGTYILSDAQAERSVSAALASGMRLVDTARIYGNEAGVGRAIASSDVPRDQVFLTTKLWTADFGGAAEAIDGALRRLGVDYVDLMLLHHPSDHDRDAYHAMEDAVRAGKIGSIGISNFYFYVPEFEDLLDEVDIVPAVVQNETHPLFPEREELLRFAREGTVLESWFPLGGKGNEEVFLQNEAIASIARAHGKSPAQALIRWHLQSGHVAIPGSSNPAHIAENVEVLDFALTDDEMALIDAMDENRRLATY